MISKYIFFSLLVLFFSTPWIYAQKWKAKYSVSNYMDGDIHGYADYNKNGPWAIAETLMAPDNMNSYQMNMKMESYIFHLSYNDPQVINKKNSASLYSPTSLPAPSPTDIDLEVHTTGATFNIFRNDNSKNIIISQNIGLSREVVRLQLLDQNNITISAINYRSNFVSSSGRTYFRDPNSIELRINGDGIMMIKPLNNIIKKVKYTFQFYPGYKATGPKIQRNDNQGYNKSDVSHLFIDEYGGFGVYLLDNEKELYDATNTSIPPTATYAVSTNKIFWTAVFPPKQYNFNDSQCRNTLMNGSWFSYVNYHDYGDGKTRLKENPWYDAMSDPINTFWFVSNTNPNALSTYLTSTFTDWNKGDGGIFTYAGDATFWKYWQFDYTPRKSLNSNQFSLLNTVFSNLHTNNIKTLVYTSPQYFLKESRYSLNNPYTSFAINPGEPTDNTYSTTMLNNVNSFTFCNGQSVTMFGKNGVKVPILNTYDMVQAFDNSNLPVDSFMQATGMPADKHQYYYIAANREGENMWSYIDAIKKLKDSTGTGLDGIYMDTFYEFNLPRTYQLIRELKKIFGDAFILYRHASAKEGQDAYLPQIDSYANFILTGEGNYSNYYDRPFMRFFVSTYNISNSISVLYNPNEKIDDPSSNYKFLNWLYDYNVMVAYPSIKTTGNLDPKTDLLCNGAKTYYQHLPSPYDWNNRVQNNLQYHQPLHQSYYQITQLQYSPGWSSVPGDVPLVGDFNGDGKDDIAVYRRGIGWFISLFGWGLGSDSATISWGCYNDIPLTGDFDGDGKDDIAVYRSTTECGNAGDFYVALSTSSGNNISFNTNASLFVSTGISGGIPLSGDFDGDGKDDLLIYLHGTWKVFKSYGSGGISNTPTFVKNWGNYSGDLPLVGDFNGDLKTDIAIYRTSGNAAEWFVAMSTGSTFNDSPYWYLQWGNKTGDDPLIGNFDGGWYDDIMVHRTTTYPNWFVDLSKGSPTFVETYPYWSLSYGNLSSNDLPIVGDFNGDGTSDIAIYRIGSPTSLFIRLTRQGEIRSGSTGLLPKAGPHEPSNDIAQYVLYQNFPNPFNPKTTIRFETPTMSIVSLKVYNILGQEVETLLDNELMLKGEQSVEFNANNLTSGMYFYQLIAHRITREEEVGSSTYISVKKMLLLK